MTRNEAACRFWARQDAAQRKRDAEHERNIMNADRCTAHVEVWEAFEGMARLLGRERAHVIWMRDMAEARTSSASGDQEK